LPIGVGTWLPAATSPASNYLQRFKNNHTHIPPLKWEEEFPLWRGHCEICFGALSSEGIFLFDFLPFQGRTKEGFPLLFSPPLRGRIKEGVSFILEDKGGVSAILLPSFRKKVLLY